MLLRRYHSSDLNEIVRIEQQCFPPEIAWDKHEYILGITVPSADMRIAEIDNKIAGYVLVDTCEDSGHVTTLNVAPEYRRRGIARHLMDWVSLHFIFKHMSFISLEVSVENKTAIRLYNDLMYSAVTVIEDYYGEGQNAFVMVRVL